MSDGGSGRADSIVRFLCFGLLAWDGKASYLGYSKSPQSVIQRFSGTSLTACSIFCLTRVMFGMGSSLFPTAMQILTLSSQKCHYNLFTLSPLFPTISYQGNQRHYDGFLDKSHGHPIPREPSTASLCSEGGWKYLEGTWPHPLTNLQSPCGPLPHLCSWGLFAITASMK